MLNDYLSFFQHWRWNEFQKASVFKILYSLLCYHNDKFIHILVRFYICFSLYKYELLFFEID